MTDKDKQLATASRVVSRMLGLSEQELLDAFRPALESDLEAVCALRKRQYGGGIRSGDAEYLRWRYFSNGAASGSPSELWVMKLQQQLVCVCGAKRLQIAHQGQLIDALLCTDALVNPDYKAKGIGAWMNLYLQSLEPVTLAMGSNSESESMLRKLFKPMPIRNIWTYRLRTSRFFLPSLPSLLSSLIAIPVNAYLRIARFAYRPVDIPGVEFVITEDLSSCGLDNAAYDPERSQVSRSGQFIKWRYLENRNARFFVVRIMAKEREVGQVIVALRESFGSDLVGFIMDWRITSTELSREKLLSAAFKRVVDVCAKENAQNVRILCSDDTAARAVANAGFRLRHTDSKFYVAVRDEALESLLDEQRWFISYADVDGF